ncbi:hypothetical protein LIER_02607 [Lithospermum erythrorhizon]|uniref:Uncharacterized protein n=1 Tax=Lithospermum erythrorhizon TaxID=34254 RepID=A0AAV3NSN6_LITER
MTIKLIVGLFFLWSVLMPLCSGSLIKEEIVNNGRTHEAEYVPESDVLRPADIQRAKGGGGGPASIVRQPPAKKNDAAPWNMAPLLSITMAICSSFYFILVFVI